MRMDIGKASQQALSSALLEGLARFRAAGTGGSLAHGENLFSYCALAKERLIAIELPHPILGVVVSGAKEVWRGMNGSSLCAGSLFVLPAKTKMDILNLPDVSRGFYQSLILEVPDASVLLEANVPSTLTGRRRAAVEPLQVELTPHLVDAVIHAASAIADGPAQSSVRRSRLTELLALLHGDPAARPMFDLSIAGRVLALIASDLSRDWRAPEVARMIGLSESTMRRRLAEEGISFAKLLRRERMLAARHLMAQRESAQAAAIAVGYASRAHFAKRFRAAFGSNPSMLRHSDLMLNG
ncbi:AraC family transcriptional regulator [Rhizobium sp. H4]|uniref:helix-turn-helix transcriptional regulator n=1 Tax=Rhizobium TaxID=379 RepID=UPI000BEA2460|nr:MULTISPECIES: AraC family transcriptional regulator [Rhizobium]PDV89283.1 AraC family transcriptional regulator [Rhizobium sp. H4]WET74007.1 AraC family transcriptional regulator [Rhizobium croatiense]